jgi:hypothetical protein
MPGANGYASHVLQLMAQQRLLHLQRLHLSTERYIHADGINSN